MKIYLAEHSGFCFGVKRALQITLENANNHIPLVTLGPLIHNRQMVERLKEMGVDEVDDVAEVGSRKKG